MTAQALVKLAVFEGKQIRKTIHNDEWWFSVVDVCEVLTESPDAGAYWRKLKQRLSKEGSKVVTNCHGLKLPAADAKKIYHRLRQYRRDVPHHSVNPLTQGRTVQTLAGTGWV